MESTGHGARARGALASILSLLLLFSLLLDFLNQLLIVLLEEEQQDGELAPSSCPKQFHAMLRPHWEPGEARGLLVSRRLISRPRKQIPCFITG